MASPDSSVTRCSRGSGNVLPITAALCSTSFWIAGSRSIRDSSSACSDDGRLACSLFGPGAYAPRVPARTPVSASMVTSSSMKNGLPAVRSPDLLRQLVERAVVAEELAQQLVRGAPSER